MKLVAALVRNCYGRSLGKISKRNLAQFYLTCLPDLPPQNRTPLN